MTQLPKHLPAKKRREATVEAMIELAGEQNPSEITTTAIADRMGLTQGAIFRHFPNKDAILQAVISWVSERLLTRINKATKNATSPTKALEAIFMTHINFVSKHPGIPRMLFSELQRSEKSIPKQMAQALNQRYVEHLHHLLEEGKTQGELDADLNVNAAALLFIGTIQGLVIQSLIANDINHMRHDAPNLFAIYLRGISRMDNTK